mmetsp:Transcript_45240/g.175652  ORF Transcript_45240/g.175652 Transcript_45240/m.175652 type:complete len:179 (-) Transcript_45240:2588-3124(-)
MKAIGTCTLNKVFLEFSERFWSEKDRHFAFIDEELIKGVASSSLRFYLFESLWESTRSSSLLAYSFGADAESQELLSDQELGDAVINVLSNMFSRQRIKVVKVKASRWHSDTFARGSFPFVPVNASPEDFNIMSDPVAERIFFAGDGTTTLFPGSVRGAFASGRREAKRIAELYNRRP